MYMLSEKTEDCGGFIWGWKKFLSGKLVKEEGEACGSRWHAQLYANSMLRAFAFRHMASHTVIVCICCTIDRFFRSSGTLWFCH